MKTSTLYPWQPLAKSLAIVLFGVVCVAPIAFALPAPSTPENVSQEDLVLPKESLGTLFKYHIENRPDPFVPFITEKAASANIHEIIPVAEQLSGMQLFEAGQLNLVAIVMLGDKDFAMVEDTTGKGYILHTGMKIGRRGIITTIQGNEVIIEETAFTRAGKKLTSKIVMLLKKEGEE
jgi:type IV pilus assembly protein PilP